MFPALPLIIVLASWIQVKNDTPVIWVLSAVSWPWGARVLRSQALSIRQKDFVQAAIVSGESTIRIVWLEMLPNMVSLAVARFVGTLSYAIITSVSLKFVGLGDNGTVSWGTILYWAQNASAIETGGWWLYVPAGLCITLLVTALTLVNFGVDTISNPRLRIDKVKTGPKSRETPSTGTGGRRPLALTSRTLCIGRDGRGVGSASRQRAASQWQTGIRLLAA